MRFTDYRYCGDMTGQTDSMLQESVSLAVTLHFSQLQDAKLKIVIAQRPGNQLLPFHSVRSQLVTGVGKLLLAETEF